MAEVIKSYKGFNKDMTCRGFQYEEGKEYEEEKADACHSGFHACEYPLDCLNYYSPNESEKRLKVMKTAVHPLRQVTTVHPLPTIPRVLRSHGDTREKQWVSLVLILYLLSGNTLVEKIMIDMTDRSRKHGNLSVRRCFG